MIEGITPELLTEKKIDEKIIRRRKKETVLHNKTCHEKKFSKFIVVYRHKWFIVVELWIMI